MSTKSLAVALSLGVATLAAATAAVLWAAPRAQSSDSDGDAISSGTWSIESRDVQQAGAPAVQITLRGRSRGGHWDNSMPILLSDLRGLSADRMKGPGGDVSFQIVRDAGTIACTGTFRGDTGAGHFTFAASPDYLAAMRGLGYGTIQPGEVFSLALHDVSRAFIKEITDLGYPKLALDDLVAFRIHGVSGEMVRELQALGYRHPEPDGLVSLRIHGATPEFVRGLKGLGYDPPPPLDDLVSMRIHGVTPEMIRSLHDLGYARVAVDDLVSMRIHGATPEFVRDLKQLGYEHVAVDDLVSMRIHGVSPDFVRRANERSGQRLPVDDLVSMRIHGQD